MGRLFNILGTFLVMCLILALLWAGYDTFTCADPLLNSFDYILSAIFFICAAGIGIMYFIVLKKNK